MTSVEFHDQPALGATEIGNVWADCVLSAELSVEECP
jgi:hypothetical protein